MITKFFGRASELAALNKAFAANKFEFFPVYGRRRIGKTELILHFIAGKPAIYFLATAGTKKENLERFKETAKAAIDLTAIKDDWQAVLEHIADHTQSRLVIAIDEFPYLIESEKGLASVFQAAIDSKLKNSRVFLILCGSSMSLMLKNVLGYKAPLYGRRTGQIHLKELSFAETLEFLEKPIEEAIQAYSICGGVPAYLQEFAEKKDLFELIGERVLAPASILREEIPFLLRQEFRDPKVYLSILAAIAMGLTSLGKIIGYCGFGGKTGLMPYLNALEGLGYVKRETSVTDKPRSKKSRYVLKDPFAFFWLKFVRQNQGLIERNPAQALQEIRKHFNAYVGAVFERVCLQALEKRKDLAFNKIGRYWDKQTEIDAVGLNDDTKEILFCECKWQNRQVKAGDLLALQEKSQRVPWNNAQRTAHYAFFSKKGFEKKALDFAAQKKNWKLYDLKDLEHLLKQR